jgi:hypothetical protein
VLGAMDDLAALGGVSVFFGTEPSSGISRFANETLSFLEVACMII